MIEDIEIIKDLLKSEKFDEAETRIENALLKDPYSPDVLVLKGELSFHTCKLKEAEKIYLDIIHSSPNHIAALNDLACVKIVEKKWDEAINLLHATLKINPLYEDAKENLNFIFDEVPVFRYSIKKIRCITFPRSGHWLLEQCLRDYFGEDFYYCEFYHHCNEIPCTDSKTNFQKNHDLDQQAINSPTYNYVIQYRYPTSALVSFYTLAVKEGWKAVVYEDNKKEWMRFAEEKIKFWRSFVQKWVINNDNPNTVFVKYEDLINNPRFKLKEVISFMKPSKKVDLELVDDIVRKRNIKFRNDVKEFKYYDPYFFADIEQRANEELLILFNDNPKH
jgi:hypothetical protein